VRGKGTKLGEGCPKVRLGQDRMPILGEGEGTKRDFWDYYADLWFDSGFLCLGRLRLGLFHSGKVRGAVFRPSIVSVFVKCKPCAYILNG
jgi:hypothetical protein